MSHRVTLVRTDISEEPTVSIVGLRRIGELGTTLAIFLRSVRRLLVTVDVFPSSPILVTLIMEDIYSSETQFLDEPHGVTSQCITQNPRIKNLRYQTKKQTNSVALNPRANYTDWVTATCRRNLVSTFVDSGVSRGQRGGSPTVVNLSFLDRSRYFSFK
jgi:hypothetical protein